MSASTTVPIVKFSRDASVPAPNHGPNPSVVVSINSDVAQQIVHHDADTPRTVRCSRRYGLPIFITGTIFAIIALVILMGMSNCTSPETVYTECEYGPRVTYHKYLQYSYVHEGPFDSILTYAKKTVTVRGVRVSTGAGPNNSVTISQRVIVESSAEPSSIPAAMAAAELLDFTGTVPCYFNEIPSDIIDIWVSAPPTDICVPTVRKSLGVVIIPVVWAMMALGIIMVWWYKRYTRAGLTMWTDYNDAIENATGLGPHLSKLVAGLIVETGTATVVLPERGMRTGPEYGIYQE